MRIEPRLIPSSPLPHPNPSASDGDGPVAMRAEPRLAAAPLSQARRAASRAAASQHIDDRRHPVLHVLAYLAAVVIGLSIGQAAILLASRTEFLHWANVVLNLVSGH